MIIAIVGPTASGKSKFALDLALKLKGEIINADAFQIYEELNIGTAKPNDEEFKLVPHHLFNIRKANEEYSIYEYQKDFRKVVEELEKRKVPIIIVGGTGLYLKAAIYDYDLKDDN